MLESRARSDTARGLAKEGEKNGRRDRADAPSLDNAGMFSDNDEKCMSGNSRLEMKPPSCSFYN